MRSEAATQASLAGHALTLRTFEGFGIGDKDAEFADLDSAMRAFLDTPASRIPRLRTDGRTVLALDPEAGLAPLFMGDDASVAAAYDRLMPAARQDAAFPCHGGVLR